MNVGPSEAMVAVSRSARRAWTAALTTRERPKNTKRRRSRRKAKTKGSSRQRIVRPRRHRLIAHRRAGAGPAPSGEERGDDPLLESPHLGVDAVVAFGMLVAEHVESAVDS